MIGLNLRFRQNLHEDPGALGRQAKTYVHKQGALTRCILTSTKYRAAQRRSKWSLSRQSGKCILHTKEKSASYIEADFFVNK